MTQQLWVGLGNPEPGMAANRHNIGFMALDVIATRHGFTPWRRRFKGAFAEGTIAGTKILALKPLTYMNNSGESVQEAAAFYKLPPEAIVAFHDELDLAPGKMRVKKGGGAAGPAPASATTSIFVGGTTVATTKSRSITALTFSVPLRSCQRTLSLKSSGPRSAVNCSGI